MSCNSFDCTRVGNRGEKACRPAAGLESQLLSINELNPAHLDFSCYLSFLFPATNRERSERNTSNTQ